MFRSCYLKRSYEKKEIKQSLEKKTIDEEKQAKKKIF